MVHRGKQEIWSSVLPGEATGPLADDTGILTALEELHLSPGGVFALRPREEAEIVTYVYLGSLTQEDSTGNSGVVHAGEFQRMITGSGIRHKETNASRTAWAHTFRVFLRPSEVGLEGSREQRRFAAAQRHNVLCVVASPDGRRGSLRLLQNALIYSSVLDSGHHLIHELLPGRSAWLHIIHGETTLRDVNLSAGDGAGITQESAVSLTAQESTELLLVDLGHRRGRSPAR